MNGYFRLMPTDSGTDIAIFAPTAQGKPVAASTISDYLSAKAVSFDTGELDRAVKKAVSANIRIKLNSVKIGPVDESLNVSVSRDKMEAYVMLFAPSEGGKGLTEDEMKQGLMFRGIKSGILDDVVKQLTESPVYCEDVVIAKGAMPVPGKDGYVEYLFDTDQNKRPTLLEDGSVDFFHLNMLHAVAENHVVARLHPSEPGKPGYTVDGGILGARVPNEASFRLGGNVRIGDNPSELLACCDGNISLVAGQVFVNNNASFENISTSTGNIEYEGTVTVLGNVDTNFSVRAKGDIIVNGVVEGAELEAGGNIIVAKGVNGMGKARLKAGGNIISKYLENAEATAGGYISSEAIMHSTISAGGDILVDGKKGVLSGGKATSGGTIEVKTLGAEMANDTIVEVGLSPAIKREIANLRKNVTEKQQTLNQIQPVLQNLALKVKGGATLSNDQKAYVAKLMAAQKAGNEEIQQMADRLDALESKYNVDTEASVKVKGTVYPGTRVCISDVSMAVKTPAKYCRFIRLRGDVKITAYE